MIIPSRYVHCAKNLFTYSADTVMGHERINGRLVVYGIAALPLPITLRPMSRVVDARSEGQGPPSRGLVKP